MDVLEFSWLSFGFAVVNFLVLVALLTRFLHRPLLDVLERRRRRIESALEEAERKAAEARAAEETYRTKLAAIREERDRLLAEARRRAEEVRQKALADAREAAEREIEARRRDGERERREALEHLREAVLSAALDIAGRVLQKAGGETIEAELHAGLLRGIAALKDRPAADLTDARTPVKAVSARPLDAPRRKAIRDAVQAVAGPDAEVVFETDEALLAGARIEFNALAVDASLADALEAVRRQAESERRDEEPKAPETDRAAADPNGGA